MVNVSRKNQRGHPPPVYVADPKRRRSEHRDVCHGLCQLIMANRSDKIMRLRWSSLSNVISGRLCRTLSEGIGQMAEGTIKRLTDKGFGFIDTGSGQDMFFHSSALEGVSYDELQEGQRVSFTEGRGPKGPRAENVKLV